TGALADFIGAILFPIGPYFPGFTLSAAMSGFIPAVVLRLFPKGETGFWPILLATFVRGLVVSVLNTLWLAILSNKAMWVLLPPRLLGSLLQIPIYALILYYVVKGLGAYRRSLVSQEAR
ncbi:MAG: folate family ECF transporter S component, partial [Firmicutes bacterium]|nr:folate family ECF transporter S component [Bacillota bacterium]